MQVPLEIFARRWQTLQAEFMLALFHHRSPLLNMLFIGVSFLGNYASFTVWAAALAFFRRAAQAQTLFLAASAAMIVTDLFKHAFDTKRPYLHLHVEPLYLQSAAGASFPSGHVLLACAVFTYLLLLTRVTPLRVIAVCAWVLLLALSRLYLLVHWPIDVFAGAVIGVTLGALLYNLRNVLLHNFAPFLWVMIIAISVILHETLVEDTMIHLAFGFSALAAALVTTGRTFSARILTATGLLGLLILLTSVFASGLAAPLAIPSGILTGMGLDSSQEKSDTLVDS
ncbi:phosphatase PAP2 family protein [Ferroacidibacillus organovorans]|uniref:Phosphatidic acid phosphatase type 2/haloperoxidase domain-containing protein n=1 Tax=Ferroacidibacillus organovorans TaxID=1765683 RepID=A0A101XR50_9BACL|nr:phosphatase PAP2 family protein [Ferroacidibacillus organovorans]KUO95999.1 hypothetical protein ATW55_02675 [Ferroacidibacillus organovorans]